MTIQKTNVLKASFIGKHVTIMTSDNPSVVGLEGTIIDETKHTFVIEKDGKDRRVRKNGSTFKFTIEGKITQIKGEDIELSLPERIRAK